MELLLWRHCDAAASASDALRPLTPRGRDEARRMAQWLGSRLPNPCRIVVSPAVRAQQTAEALQREFETSAALAPGAAISDVLRVVNWPGASVVTLIVGHEPTLGAVAGHLLGGTGSQRTLPKGALVWMASVDESSRAVLKAAVAPDSI